MIENPYRQGSEPAGWIHTQHSSLLRKPQAGLFGLWCLGNRMQVLMLLIILSIFTFYMHGANSLMHEGGLLLGRLRGSQDKATDDIVAKDKLRIQKETINAHLPSKPSVDLHVSDRTSAKLLLEESSNEQTKKELALEELRRVQEEAKVAREEVAKAQADAEAARAEAEKARADTARLDAQRAASEKSALESRALEEQMRLVVEQRMQQEKHTAEMARLEAEAHQRDIEEQIHNQPVQQNPGITHSEISAVVEESTSKADKDGISDNDLLPNGMKKLPSDYVNPFDPKPGHVPPTVATPAPRPLVCDGTMDPFTALPVDSFDPPETAQLSDKREWKEKQSAMMSRIRAFNQGGKPLRELIDKEVQELALLRVKLFCSFALQGPMK